MGFLNFYKSLTFSQFKSWFDFNDTAFITTFSPVITAGSGTITTKAAISKYKIIGKTCFISIIIQVTTNGTGALWLNCTLPFSSVGDHGFMGLNTTTSKTVGGTVTNGSSSLVIRLYDGSYPITSAQNITISGFYQI